MFKTRATNKVDAPKLHDHTLWPFFSQYISLVVNSLSGGRYIRTHKDVESCVLEGMDTARAIMRWIRSSNERRISRYAEREALRNFESELRTALAGKLHENLAQFDARGKERYQTGPSLWNWLFG